ncbi:hypothetical protein [Burkholderia cepacia]|uniref:hypothetical protein n=1 Tax=Burkholderia cepacia TaxID=292 RepID=UPI00158B0DC7|nr:hypothetical protein [Burkholderia cepacia]
MNMKKLIKKNKGFTFFLTNDSSENVIEAMNVKRFLGEVYSDSNFNRDKLIPPVAHFIKKDYLVVGYSHKIDPKGKLTGPQLIKKFFDFALDFDCEHVFTISDHIIKDKRYSLIGHIDLVNLKKEYGIAEIDFSNEQVVVGDYVWSENAPTQYFGE